MRLGLCRGSEGATLAESDWDAARLPRLLQAATRPARPVLSLSDSSGKVPRAQESLPPTAIQGQPARRRGSTALPPPLGFLLSTREELISHRLALEELKGRLPS